MILNKNQLENLAYYTQLHILYGIKTSFVCGISCPKNLLLYLYVKMDLLDMADNPFFFDYAEFYQSTLPYARMLEM